jgi:hypothetical protein
MNPMPWEPLEFCRPPAAGPGYQGGARELPAAAHRLYVRRYSASDAKILV